MIEVQEAERLTWQSGSQKELTLTFDGGLTITNDDIFSESMTLEQTLSDEQNIKYGKCSAASFKVKITDTATSFKGRWFTASLTCGEYTRNLGRFKVFSDNRTDDKKFKEIVAYDAIYGLSTIDCTEWYKELTFPITMKSFRDSFFNHIGIVQQTDSLPNDWLEVERTIDPSAISALAVAQAICELNARFGQMDTEGKFRYVDIDNNMKSLYPANDLYPADDLYPKDGVYFTLTMDDYSQGSLKYEDFTTQPITKVTVREQDGDVGGSAGTGENIYYVTGNFLAYGQDQDTLNSLASGILNEINIIYYTPTSVKTMSYMPWAEVGDFVRIIGVADTISFPILKRTISGITGAKETYAASGTETMSENPTSIADQIIQLKGQSNVLTRTIDETKSTISKLEEDTDGKIETLQTQITQNATDITLEATRATGAENTLSGRITVNASNITAEVTRATGAEGTLSSRISQSAHEISLSVAGSVGQNSSAGITISLLDENGNQIDSGSGNIMLDGTVVFKNNLTDGTTQISGNNITTGKINAQYINTSGLIAEDISATTISGKTIIGSSLSTDFSSSSLKIVVADGSLWGETQDGTVRFGTEAEGLFFKDDYNHNVARIVRKHITDYSTATDEIVGVKCYGQFDFENLYINGTTISDTYLPLYGGTMTGNITTPANDNYGIAPATTNCGQVGSSYYHYYRSYINNMYTNDISLTSAETRATSAKSIYSYLNDGKYAKSIVKNATAVTVAHNTVTDLTTYKFAPGYWIIQCSALYDSVPYSGYVELFLSTTKNSTTGSDRYTSDTRYSGVSRNMRCQFTTVKHITEETELHLCARHDKTSSVSVTGGIIAMKIGEK